MEYPLFIPVLVSLLLVPAIPLWVYAEKSHATADGQIIAFDASGEYATSSILVLTAAAPWWMVLTAGGDSAVMIGWMIVGFILLVGMYGLTAKRVFMAQKAHEKKHRDGTP